MADPPDLSIPPNQAQIAAGVEPDGTRSGIALDANSRIVLSPTTAPGLPADASTATKQDAQTALLTTIDADTGGIATSTASLDAKTPADPATASAQAAQQARLDLLATQATLATLALESGGNLATRASESTLASLNAKVIAVDTGAVTVASSALPSGAAQEHTAAASPHATRLTDGSAFYKAAVAGDVMGADIRVASAAATAANPVPVQLYTSASTAVGTEPSPLVTRHPIYTETSFGQTRVAPPYTLFDNVQTYALDPLVWGTQTATGGTVAYNSTTGMTAVSVTGTSGSTARLRTHNYAVYQAGKTHRVKITCVHLDAGQTNQQRAWGFFDELDGLFFRLNGTDLELVRRTSTSGVAVDNVASRASWNGDKLDGFGTSGQTWAPTFGTIYEIDFQWLSVGVVHWWIHMPSGPVLVHTMSFPNTLTVPYMRTAVLPIQIEVANTGTSTGSTLNYICSEIEADGGNMPALPEFVRPLAAPKTIGTTLVPIISIRPAATFNGRINRKAILPRIALVTNTSGRASVAIVLGATLTGPSWTDHSTNVSAVQYDSTATAITGGSTLYHDYLPNTSDRILIDAQTFFSLSGYHLKRDAFNTTGDELTLAAKADAGTITMDATIAWAEAG